MIPNTILTFSVASSLTLIIGATSVLAPSHRTRLLAAKTFIVCITLSAVYVFMQAKTENYGRHLLVHFCTMLPVLFAWVAIIFRFKARSDSHEERMKALDNLEASLMKSESLKSSRRHEGKSVVLETEQK
ncbi:MAG: hypothetical protein JST89_24280 [Cyanobacteria bacterium SZAS-4]|nr:hypothetical protein [Cyanobacteria bacterium SZAS-4]